MKRNGGKPYTIGLLGLDFESGNLGCGALSYGFAEILGRINRAHGGNVVGEVVVYSKISPETAEHIEAITGARCVAATLARNLKFWQQRSDFGKCDFIFDFTAGDSFADIYGMKRFIRRSLTKINAIHSKAVFVMGSQTYGPFEAAASQKVARYIIRKSDYVFSRDALSSQVIRELAGREPVETVDVAFALPYEKTEPKQDKIRIGFNASGLLWSGGYTGTNQFGLSVDYRKYCCSVIEALLQMPNVEIHLIPHVLSEDMTYPDNDLVACAELASLYPQVIRAPHFKTPMEAKSYLCRMDWFTGARMHATIGAFSSGVATVPFAYSRKFAGVFDHYRYHNLIDGKTMTTEEAVEKTLTYVADMAKLKDQVQATGTLVNEGVTYLVQQVEKIFNV